MGSRKAAEELGQPIDRDVSPAGPSRKHVVAAIEEGLADGEAGRVMSHDDFRAELEAEFGPLDV